MHFIGFKIKKSQDINSCDIVVYLNCKNRDYRGI